jgi:hypothetical protein
MGEQLYYEHRLIEFSRLILFIQSWLVKQQPHQVPLGQSLQQGLSCTVRTQELK